MNVGVVMRYLLVGCLTCAVTLTAQADIMFNVTYDDVVNNTNVGFDDPTFGATRQATFSSVLSYVNSVVDHNGTVDLSINNSETDGTGFLAAAGPYSFTSPNGFANGFVFDHATTGTDPTGSVPDAEVTFDFGYNWNSDLGTPTGSEFDLFSVALHEFTHAMGFLSNVDASGNSEISGGDPGVFSVFDSFLELGNGTALFAAGGDFVGSTSDLTSNDVFFDGPNATAANGGNPVPIYSPSTFAPGSSISHITPANSLMNYSIGQGVERRTYSNVEMGILQDIGWDIQPVPEPSSFAMLGVAGCVAGYVRRRRRDE